ncbi:MAG: hypothetical protein AAGB34_11040 [Planctomycetota bacterium]
MLSRTLTAFVVLPVAAAAAHANVYSLASEYTGTWMDPNFLNDQNEPVNGSANITVELLPNQGPLDVVRIAIELGGAPGGGPLPAFSADFTVQGDGSINEIGIEFPDLDADLIFNTGGDFSPTPTLDFSLATDGTLNITAFDAAGFERIEATGVFTATEFSITADVFNFGQLISSGGTVAAIPAPSTAVLASLAGLAVTRRRRSV